VIALMLERTWPVAVTVAEVAHWVGGEVVGNPVTPVPDARPLAEAKTGDLTFVEDAAHLPQLDACPAAAAIVGPGVVAPGKTHVRVADPLMAFAAVVARLYGPFDDIAEGIDPSARVHPTVTLGPGARVAPLAVIGAGTVIGANCRVASGAAVGARCRIGDDVTIHANAVLYDRTVLGHRVIVHGNAVLGADGFGYRFQQGRHVKVPQLGYVEIGDDVEIGACTTVDRGTFGPTRVGAGTKIDNLVQIGHNCSLGKHNVIISQVGMAGSTTTGDYVAIAGQVGITGHLHIGERTQVGGQSAVIRDVPAGVRVLGSPAKPEREEKRILLTLEKLPEMYRQLKDVLRRLGIADAA
jgi:UDP-3-O-[3-hydroxymyristoyl] glucosamine N-acyltransferase